MYHIESRGQFRKVKFKFYICQQIVKWTYIRRPVLDRLKQRCGLDRVVMQQDGKETAYHMINAGFCINAMIRALIYRLAICIDFAIKFYIGKFKQDDLSILRRQLLTKYILLKIIVYCVPCHKKWCQDLWSNFLSIKPNFFSS